MAQKRKAPERDLTTRERILEAGEALFCSVGYDGVCVRDVAERAGVPKALVFYYFESKEGLFEAVLARYYELHRAALESAMSSAGTVRQPS